jgi:hypothetical protein
MPAHSTRSLGRPRSFKPLKPWGGRAAEQSFGAQVFVDVRRVNAVPAAGDTPVLPLGRGFIQQTWMPGERDRDRPPIPQRDSQRVFLPSPP